MGMIGNLLRVSNTKLEAYLKDSSILETDIYNDEASSEITIIDIDKAWDGIIFLLTGDSAFNAYEHPLAKVLFSGELINPQQDFGYGPAHYVTPGQVVELNNHISTISIEDLKQKYNPEKMQEVEVYPEIWERDGDDGFDYLQHYFQQVQKIYADAAENGEAVITYLS